MAARTVDVRSNQLALQAAERKRPPTGGEGASRGPFHGPDPGPGYLTTLAKGEWRKASRASGQRTMGAETS